MCAFPFLATELQQQQWWKCLLNLLHSEAIGRQRRAFHQCQLPGSSVSLQFQLQGWQPLWWQELRWQKQEVQQSQHQLELWLQGPQIRAGQTPRPCGHHSDIIHSSLLNQSFSARWDFQTSQLHFHFRNELACSQIELPDSSLVSTSCVWHLSESVVTGLDGSQKP